jgi:hypothetical protein
MQLQLGFIGKNHTAIKQSLPVADFLLLFDAGAGDDKFTFPLWKKIVAGGFSGCIGAAIANPTGEAAAGQYWHCNTSGHTLVPTIAAYTRFCTCGVDLQPAGMCCTPVPLLSPLLCACAAAADLLKVRAQAINPDTGKPFYSYPNPWKALGEIFRNEGGLAGLYRCAWS